MTLSIIVGNELGVKTGSIQSGVSGIHYYYDIEHSDLVCKNSQDANNRNAIHCRLDKLAIDSLCGLHRFSFVGQHAKHCTNVMTSCKQQTL